jgi:hypothetical protein
MEANSTSENDMIFLEISYNFLKYLYLLIALIGSLANMIAFTVFSRKKFENTIFSTYFRVLLVVDTIGLLYLALGRFIYFEFEMSIRDQNIVLCRLTMILAYSIPQISAHFTVIISFERWLLIAKPNVFLIRKKAKFQIQVCIIIVLVNLIYNCQLFFSYMRIGVKECLIINENLLSIMDLINSTILPFFLMTLFSVLTIKAVFDSRSKIRKAVLNPDTKSKNDTSRKRDIKFAITTILLNFIFLFLNGPQSMFFLISNKYFNYAKSGYSNLVVHLTIFMTYVNNTSVFFINLTANTQFREELLLMIYEIKKIYFKQPISNHQ